MYMLILNFTYPLRCLRVPPVEYHWSRAFAAIKFDEVFSSYQPRKKPVWNRRFEDRVGPRNVGFIQTPDAADSPRLHRLIWLTLPVITSRNSAHTNVSADLCFVQFHQYSDWATSCTTGVRFSARPGFFSLCYCAQTGSGAHPASCQISTGCPFPWV
jgi:hypothetical protein